MFCETLIPAETVQAYLATEFRVLGNTPFTLKLNQVSLELLAFYRQSQAQSVAFITAWNPYSQIFTPSDNKAAQLRLIEELNLRQLRNLPGIGIDPSGMWPGEESCLILGVSLEDARVIGNLFKQNGIVWAGADAIPKLILLR